MYGWSEDAVTPQVPTSVNSSTYKRCMMMFLLCNLHTPAMYAHLPRTLLNKLRVEQLLVRLSLSHFSTTLVTARYQSLPKMIQATVLTVLTWTMTKSNELSSRPLKNNHKFNLFPRRKRFAWRKWTGNNEKPKATDANERDPVADFNTFSRTSRRSGHAKPQCLAGILSNKFLEMKR